MKTKHDVFAHIDDHGASYKAISRYIGANPELGNKEFMAAAKITEELERQGFRVERGVLGLETAFIGTYDSERPGPVAAFLCEYDALPDVGHACGHHLICMMSLAAGAALKSVVDATGGSIRIYGTPAEETNGAKVTMAAAGLFDDCDFALMAHPYYKFEKSGSSLAMDAIQFEFFGQTAHAAASPHEGVNALDAVLQLFNSINAMRQQTRPDARIHGIIDNGGTAPNVIPGYASAKFYARSASRTYTNELTEKLKRCAEGAALQTGCTLKRNMYELSYDELRTNETLSNAFTANLLEAGIPEHDITTGVDHGSLDLGNVSLRCPAIHPYVKIVEERYLLHTVEFRDAAMTERALERMIFGAKMLAATAYDVVTTPKLLAGIKSEFEQTNASV
ncbi:M20 family metallopeptidase [Paenibacillus methanolicus]|uniref:Peptidase M20 domain-containing protein 2 n=1 Tax=Paenibacillus methanolicus TaxID=582686 RepID=A0A5S5C537_9BACL|nr:M20 family metallopeptidase [Paenibacillus methanolicus]TYP73728.1 amidohydrolase [Paenibacillus methanolicus]